jgi:putative MATE family efflux protein
MHSVQKQGTAPIGRLLLQYSLPAVAGFLANALYQFVDRVMVGRGVGTEGMAAVTSAYPLTMLSMGIGLLLGTGTGNMISTLLGKGDKEAAEKTLGQSLRLGLLLGTGLAALLWIFARPVLHLCGAEGEVLEMAVPYLRITAVGQIFLIAIISMGNILRTQGRPGLGLAFMVSGNVVNAGLCAIGIFALKMGVSGAAWATFAALALNLAAVLVFVQSRHSILRIRRRNLSSDRELASRILKLGAPIFLMQILGTLTFLAANHGAGNLGGARGIAMVGVFNTVSILLIYPALGVAQAMQPLVAFNRGAGNVDRVRKLLGSSLAITTTIGIVAALAVGIFPGPVASLFTRTDTRLVDMVRDGLPWFMVSIALFGVQGTASHYFLAIHQPGKAAALLLGRQILAIPLFLVLPRLFGMQGLYLVSAVSDAPLAILAALYLRVEWKRLSAGSDTDPQTPETAPVAETA